MIFTAPRFVVVDDKPEHLKPIVHTFQSLGAPCTGIHYDLGQGDLDKALFQRVRYLFMDLHLTGDEMGTDHRRHFTAIAGILEDNIDAENGGFVLILWTEHEHHAAGLQEYLREIPSHARPITVLCLAKDEFIHTDTGDPRQPEKLQEAIREKITAIPHVAALLIWETQVLNAANDTLASLVRLVPEEQRTDDDFAKALGAWLHRLANAAVGEKNINNDPHTAINHALAPILIDRILHQDKKQNEVELWQCALQDGSNDQPDDKDAGQLNRMLHLSLPSSNVIRPIDWGTVVTFPEETDIKKVFGLEWKELLETEFKIKPDNDKDYLPCLVRIGAPCDYAQQRPGPIPFLLGVESPVKKDKPPAAMWRSPTLYFDNGQNSDPFELRVSTRLSWNILAEGCETWTVKYRLREQLLMTLINHASTYNARPGIISLR